MLNENIFHRKEPASFSDESGGEELWFFRGQIL